MLNSLVAGLHLSDAFIEGRLVILRLFRGARTRDNLFQSPENVLESITIYGLSSIGRAADSKSAGWGFDSLRPCTSFRSQVLPFGSPQSEVP